VRAKTCYTGAAVFGVGCFAVGVRACVVLAFANGPQDKGMAMSRDVEKLDLRLDRNFRESKCHICGDESFIFCHVGPTPCCSPCFVAACKKIEAARFSKS